MAIVKGTIQATGSVGGISFYTRRGSDQIIMRTKGGVSGDKIKRLPQYEGLRNQQKEWSGATKLASAVRYSFGGLHRLSYYNLTSVLNGMANKMQKADTADKKGQRPVRLSLYKQALEGFNFNRNYPFNSVLRVSLSVELNRETLSASVTFPRINTDIDLLNVQRLPFFRLLVAVGTASDMVYNADIRDYVPIVEGLHGASAVTTGAWHSANTIVDEQTLTAQMTAQQIDRLTADTTVLVSVAVEFGMVGFSGTPQEVKYAGSGKVLACR